MKLKNILIVEKILKNQNAFIMICLGLIWYLTITEI